MNRCNPNDAISLTERVGKRIGHLDALYRFNLIEVETVAWVGEDHTKDPLNDAQSIEYWKEIQKTGNKYLSRPNLEAISDEGFYNEGEFRCKALNITFRKEDLDVVDYWRIIMPWEQFVSMGRPERIREEVRYLMENSQM